MADDRMKNDDLQRNMGNREDQDYGQKTPGRTGQGGEQGGQHAGGQAGKGGRDREDEDLDTGAGRTGEQNRGGQNR